MTEDNHRNWDVSIKLFGSLITIVTIIVGVYQYKTNNEREYRKKVYDEQFVVYTEFIESIVTLSKWKKNKIFEKNQNGNRVLSEDFKIDYANFEKIYYGRLRLMQTGNVDSLATQFFVLFNQYKDPHSRVTETELDNLIGIIIDESKKSLENTWDIDIKSLQ